MRSNSWTTLEECEFLHGHIPQFLKHQETRVVAPFLATVATSFLAKFPSRRERFEREALVTKIRTWFGNHTRNTVKGDDARHVLDLTGKSNRQPIALQPAQAYSLLYYSEGSPLWHEINNLYESYKSGDPATLTRLGPLFKKVNAVSPPPVPNSETVSPADVETASPASIIPTSHPNGETPAVDAEPPVPDTATRRRRKKKSDTLTNAKPTPKTPPFVHFQQTIIREKLKTMSAEEAAAVEDRIESSLASAMKLWERPWLTSDEDGDEDGDANQLEMEYYQKNIPRVDQSLQVVGEEITRQTSFKTFFLWGGSAPFSGTVSVTLGQTGKTVDGDQSFAEFLGPTFTEVEEKFRQWVQLTYTPEDIQRRKALNSFTPPTGLGNTTILTPPQTAPPTRAQSPLTAASTPVSPPPPAMRVPRLPSAAPLLSSPPVEPVPPSPPVEPVPPSPPIEPVPPSPLVDSVPPSPLVEPVPPSSPVELVPPSPSIEPAPPPQSATAIPISLPLPTPQASSSPTPPSRSDVVLPSPSQVLTPPTNQTPADGNTVSPNLGPSPPYPKFITPVILDHLNSITNVPGWSDLVQDYLAFEVASPSKGVTRLPSNGRPPVVDAWLKDPTTTYQVVSDIANYGESWKVWWIGCQPQVRAKQPWPFPQEPSSDIQWGKLLNGGKHGIFLFVMALSWWATSLDPAPNYPELAVAISDLNWVTRQLTASFVVPPGPHLTPPATLEGQDTSRSKRKVKLTEKAMNGGDRVQKRFCR